MADIFMIPGTDLGHVEDVLPEKLTSQHNEWIHLSREVLKRRRSAPPAPPGTPNIEISKDSVHLAPFGAEHCPALKEAMQMGFLLKWPAHAVFRRVSPKAWQIKTPHNFNFYFYHHMTSFAEGGEAEAIAVNTGWMCVTPPGWSILFKNLPNNLSGMPGGIRFAEGVIRSDMATVGLQVHAFIPPDAPDEIKVKRGDPMGVIFPFKREPLNLVVMDDENTIHEATRLSLKSQATFHNAPHVYKTLYMDNETDSGLYGWCQGRTGAPEGQPPKS